MHLAAGTHAGHGAIFDDLAAHHRIDDLPAFGQNLHGQLGAVVPAPATSFQRQPDALLGVLDQCSGGAGVIRPTTGFLAAAHAARARRRFPERRVRARRLAGVVLSLPKRVSSSRMGRSSSAICFACSAVCDRNRASSASLLSGRSVVDGGLGMLQTYRPRRLFGKLT
jgi:hypothetical protein